MKIKTDLTRTLQRYLHDFEEAAIALSWLGSKPPEEHQEIQDSYHAAKRRLHRYLLKLERMAHS